MRKRGIAMVFALLCLAAPTTVWAQGSTGSKNVSIGAASIGSAMYSWLAAWSKILNEKVQLASTVEVTPALLANIRLLESGENAFGGSSGALLHEGWTGTGWAAGRQYRTPRVILPIYPGRFYAFSLDSEIRTLKDLHGKAVGTAAVGSVSNTLGRRILAELGIKPSRIVNAGWADINTMMKDGLIQAAFTFGGVPQPNVTELEAGRPVSVFAMTEAERDTVLKALPYLAPGAIAANAYKSQPKALATVAGWNFVIARADLPDDLVYRIVKATYENRQVLLAGTSLAAESDPENVLHSPIPLHPGAIRYYREIGLTVPAKLIP